MIAPNRTVSLLSERCLRERRKWFGNTEQFEEMFSCLHYREQFEKRNVDKESSLCGASHPFERLVRSTHPKFFKTVAEQEIIGTWKKRTSCKESREAMNYK